MNTINTIMTNTVKQINNNTIQLRYNLGTKKEYYNVYHKIIPGCVNKNYILYGVTTKDLTHYIKYKGEHYA